MVRLVVLSVVQSLLLCSGQVMLKLAVRAMDRSLPMWSFFVHSIVTNWWLLGCGVFMTAAGLLWMYILRHFALASAYPLTALSFVFGAIAAQVVFDETVNWQNWLGIVFIVVGCCFVVK